MESLRLWLVRHGETEVGSDGLYRPSHGLTARGRQQATEVAAVLRGVGIEVCYTSTLQRAIETAQTLTYGTELDLVQIADLCEIETGDIYTASDEVKQQVIGHKIELDFSQFGGESAVEFSDRVAVGYQHMFNDIRRRGVSHVAAFLHGGTIAAILDMLAGRPFSYRNRPRMPNCSYSMVELGRNSTASEWTGWESAHLTAHT